MKAAEFFLVARRGVLRVGFDPLLLRVESAEKIARMFAENALHQLLWCDAVFFGAQHDRRAVLVVGAAVMHFIALHALKAHPDIGLDIFDQMPEVDGAIGIG